MDTNQLQHALADALAQTSSPQERAELLRTVILDVYDHVKTIHTGDGLDGYDSPERAAVGELRKAIEDYYYRLV